MTFTVGDLCCGIGGASTGAMALGGRPQWAMDTNPVAIDCYNANHPGTAGFVADVRTFSGYLPPVDVAIAGVPCQPFSNARDPKLPPHKDEWLALHVAATLARVMPQWIFVENVPAFLKSAPCKAMTDRLRDAGYTIEAKIVDLTLWGVPQTRRRAIVVASREFRLLEFPPAPRTAETPWGPVAEDLLDGLQRTYPTVHQQARLPEFPGQVSLVPRAGARSDRELDVRPGDRSAFTIRALGRDQHWRQADVWMGGDEFRVASPRLLARLQTFPDSFVLPEVNWRAGHGVGNAVPPKFFELFMRTFLCR